MIIVKVIGSESNRKNVMNLCKDCVLKYFKVLYFFMIMIFIYSSILM